MTLAAEIRAAIAKMPNRSDAELWKHCPTAKSQQHFYASVSQLVFRREVIATKGERGQPRTYRMSLLFGGSGAPLSPNRNPALRILSQPHWESLVRPGGLDYRKYPSLAGGVRIPYHIT